MSYINDALRRLQKEKGSPYEAYSHIVGSSTKMPRRYSKWMSLAGILMVFSFAAAMILFLNNLEHKRVQIISYNVVLPAAPKIMPEIKEQGAKKQSVVAPQKVKRQAGAAAAVYAQALQKHRAGKLAEAKKLYRRVIGIDARNLSALNNLGVIYTGEGDYRRAIVYFQKALDINSKYVEAHYNLACVYAQKKDKDRSLFYLKNAIEFNPQARNWARQDVDFKFLQTMPEFVDLTGGREKSP